MLMAGSSISFYAKMPDDIAERWVLLLDPMLGESNEVAAN
jgi:uracil phosphoribosyltransferase